MANGNVNVRAAERASIERLYGRKEAGEFSADVYSFALRVTTLENLEAHYARFVEAHMALIGAIDANEVLSILQFLMRLRTDTLLSRHICRNLLMLRRYMMNQLGVNAPLHRFIYNQMTYGWRKLVYRHLMVSSTNGWHFETCLRQWCTTNHL